MKKTLLSLLMVLALLVSCAALADDAKVTVTVYDSDGVTVINEIELDKGAVLEDLGVTKEGYVIAGIYVTPALLRTYDMSKAVDADMSLFVAWQSAKVDERPWMLAGSFKCYPDNAWGKVWPQDGYLLQPVEGEFNTFAIEVSLYKDDQFKIAVIGEGYVWDDTSSMDSRNVIKSEYLSGGEDAFDTGANIKVLQDGLYRLIIKTDAETLALCKLDAERLGDAAPAPVAEYKFDLQIHASFLGWDVAQNVVLTRNGEDYLWYGEFDVAEDGEFGVKNYGSDAWFAAPDGNIKITAGHYMLFIKLNEDNTLAEPIAVGAPAYYVVGTCGNGGWAGDANADNVAFMLEAQEDGTFAKEVTFTDAETAEWAGNKVAFKVVYGACGKVANEFWFSNEAGDNITADPGTYTISFDPATKVVEVK